MSNRENIVAEIVTQIGNATGVQTVTREPKALEELATSSFPHVLVETANETRTHASIGGTSRRVSDLDVLLNIVVYGNNRDQSRNTIIDAIETQLELDPTLNGNLPSDDFFDHIHPLSRGSNCYQFVFFNGARTAKIGFHRLGQLHDINGRRSVLEGSGEQFLVRCLDHSAVNYLIFGDGALGQ